MGTEGFSLDNQRRIYRHVLENPGSHLRRIAEKTSIPLSTLRYHIGYMVKQGLVIAKPEGNLKTFFINGKISHQDRNITPLLQQKRFRDIIVLLLVRPAMSHSEVCSELGLKPSTLTKYMRAIESRDIVYAERNGRETRYTIVDEERIVRLLLSYKETFWDRFVDNAIEIYYER